jgi:hypothetical protein
MNCDQVFDVLTRGPFPTGTDCDEPVEAHLHACADCRRLAEALRPAIELFQEAVDPEESRDLPGYWGAAAEPSRASVSYAPETAARQTLPHIVPDAAPHRHAAAGAWRMAAMVALGIALGSLASARWVLDNPLWSDTANGPAWSDGAEVGPSLAPLAATNSAPRRSLADALGMSALPALCLQSTPGDEGVPRDPRGELLLASVSLKHVSLENVHCCTGCHHAEAANVPPTATAKVATSCQVCHASGP